MPPDKEVPQIQLQTKEHEELLNVIDKIRSLGIGRFVDLPQIIVCGDQSSGKSSVLEAVSGIRFPVQANLCTRVATELILRRNTETRTTVSIAPSRSRRDDELKYLTNWGSTITDTSDFPKLVNDAMAAMGVDKLARPFSDDILRVEHSGPGLPALTLVDLPGLFHAATKEQSSEDRELVTELVTSYMKKSRSIILAVITAKNDIAGQVVLDRVRKIDPAGARTMGIITKPDTLEGDGDKERFLKLAENKEIVIQLGWHVLRNRGPKNIDCSAKERDEMETKFFANGIWRALPLSQIGIGALRPRLSQILMNQILTELPGLISDVENGIEECGSRLARLGQSRGNLREQKLYLLRISQTFSTLIKSAIDGLYNDSFFGSALEDEGYSKRLRAVVQNTLTEFANDLRLRGATHIIREGEEPLPETDSEDDSHHPVFITRTNWLAKVHKLLKRTRGCELPGTFNPQIIGDLFYEQSRPWESLVKGFAAQLIDATRTTIELVMEHVTDASLHDGISRQVLNPVMTRIQNDLNEKICEVLAPHRRGHPITYNHYLIDSIQKTRQARMKTQLLQKINNFFGKNLSKDDEGNFHADFHVIDPEALAESLTLTTEVDMDHFACAEATEVMQAYYKVAMKKFIDDFSVLAVEECLLRKLPAILSPEVIALLDDATVEGIAAETDDSKAERARSTEKMEALQKTLDILRRLDRHRPNVMKDDKVQTLDDEPYEVVRDSKIPPKPAVSFDSEPSSVDRVDSLEEDIDHALEPELDSDFNLKAHAAGEDINVVLPS